MDFKKIIQQFGENILSEQQNTENSSLDIPNSVDSANLNESDNPNLNFLQQALNLLYGDKPWICANNKLYYWSGTHYQHSPESAERRRITNFCNSYAADTKKVGVTFPYARPASVNEVLQWGKYCFEVSPELLNPPGLNCTNGVLQIEWQGPIPQWKLIAHTPNLYYIYEPIVTYNPNADATNCDRLLEVLDKPQQEIFLRTIAASLDLATVRQYKGRLVRALLLKGNGSNGKDTLRETVAAMYGNQGVTACTISDFKAYDDGRKSALARLRNSRVNWGAENVNTTSLDKLQSLKAFITGNILTAKNHNRDEIDYKPLAVGLFNINDTPNLEGILEASASRWAVLIFSKTFKIDADYSKGELEADPRFQYDPKFIHEQVLPAFLNRVLQALVDLMQKGIDYSCTQKALEDIQKENSHLFQFCQEMGLVYDSNRTLLASEIWNLLEQWYQNNGTLSYELDNNGKRKAIWNQQLLKSDKNVKAANQVIARFKTLFPQVKVVNVPKAGGGKPRMGLQGIGFNRQVLPQASPNLNQDYTQNTPNTSPQEFLQDKSFHPSHPISYIPNAENKKLDSSVIHPREFLLSSQVEESSLNEMDNKTSLGNNFEQSRQYNFDISILEFDSLDSSVPYPENKLIIVLLPLSPEITARTRVRVLSPGMNTRIGIVNKVFYDKFGIRKAWVLLDNQENPKDKEYECCIEELALMRVKLRNPKYLLGQILIENVVMFQQFFSVNIPQQDLEYFLATYIRYLNSSLVYNKPDFPFRRVRGQLPNSEENRIVSQSIKQAKSPRFFMRNPDNKHLQLPEE